MQTTFTSTTDALVGISLYLRRDGDDFHVTDLVGTRYGHGPTPAAALTEWGEQVADLLNLTEELGDPIKSEVTRYRQALQ